ncbi:ROK family protein [Cryptosporangium phraense]|uniref:ROK family protein n=1 Tax=Cryptosporangium phraense TaxID=2593070 RepID=A0A545AUT5_9ACTN|nr:ROK family protein [Cryptosporangium phraense]TQS45099.1 ROK family protein [Cryptosporangium phraense]
MLSPGSDVQLRKSRASGVSSASVREHNALSVIAILREHGPASRADLVRRSGLTRPTVDAIVESLLADAVVAHTGNQTVPPGAKGRPGQLLGFNAGRNTAVVCRSRRDRLEIRLTDALGYTLAEVAAPIDHTPEAFFREAAEHISHLVSTVPGAGPVAAASVLIPGLINRRTGASISHPPWGWADVPVQAALSKHLQIPVTVLNHASAAVVGEVAHGAGYGHEDVLMVLLDFGVGVGVLTGGALLRGADGAVGELGHSRVERPGRLCVCGRSGCLETVASGRFIQEEAVRIGGESSAGRTLAELSALSDRRVDLMLAGAADRLGLAVSGLVNVLNPSIVILGGTEFAAGAERFFDSFRRSVQENSLPANAANLEFALAGKDSEWSGATHAALEHMPARLRPRQSFGI